MTQSSSYKARILTASAGSGKTYSLAREYIYNILRPQPEEAIGREFNPNIYRTILAVTFTNKATEEMKSRILKQINNLASGAECEFMDDLLKMTSLSEQQLRQRALIVRGAILHDYSRFSILTNDTFFQRIVRAFAKELNIDMDYAIELDTAPVVQKSIDTLIEQTVTDNQLQKWLTDLAEENIESGHQWNIKKGLLKLKNELFDEQAKQAIAAVGDKEQLEATVKEYTELAEKEIEKIRKIGTEAVKMITEAKCNHTIFSSSFTKYFDKIAKFNYETPEPNKTFRKHCSDKASEWFRKDDKPTADQLALAAKLQPLAAKVCEMYSQAAYLSNSSMLLNKNYRSFALLNDLYWKVTDICREQNTMLLAQTKHLISKFVRYPEDAPFIYEKVGSNYEKFMIDEFQDTSLMEWQNFLPLLSNAISQSQDVAVLLVGDIKQSIYRWRGSDWNILRTIAPADLAAGSTPIIRQDLEDNYRSLPNVVNFNNKTIYDATQRLNTRLNGMLDDAMAEGVMSQPTYNELYNALGDAYQWEKLRQFAKCKPEDKGYINVTAYNTEQPDIVGRIRSLVYEKGFNPCDISILVRSNDQAETVAKVLLTAGIEDPKMRFGIMTQEALRLASSPVVQFIIATMSYAVNRRDIVSLAIFNKHAHNFDLHHIPTEEEVRFLDSLLNLSPEEAFEAIMIRYPEIFKNQGVYIDALHEQIIKFCGGKVADLQLFIKWWAENSLNKSATIEKDTNAIEIITIHKAKGLENKVIIIPFCNWKFVSSNAYSDTVWTKATDNSQFNADTLFPITATTKAGNSIFSEGYYREIIYTYIDAINVLYVALTRPKEQLHIFFPAPKAPSQDKKKKGEQEQAPPAESNVGDLIFNVLGMEALRDKSNEAKDIVYTFGEYDSPIKKSKEKQNSINLGDIAITEYNMKLALSSLRYQQALEAGGTTARDEGIALHGVMERSRTREDIVSATNQLVIDGVLSETEAAELLTEINQALTDPIAAQWFDHNWDSVLTECEIITSKGEIKRPDRVMIDGDRAVVVDYKFGKKSSDHRRQIVEYQELITEMGYSNIEGYIWYVREGKIDRVV